MPTTRFITFIIIAALLLTVLTFVGILAVQSRSGSTTDTLAVSADNNNEKRVSYNREINGQTVVIRREQGQELVILQLPEPPTAVPDPPITVEEVLPTAVPTAEVIVVPPQPTAVPPQADAGTGGVQTQGGVSSINLGVEPIIFVDHTVQAGNTLFSLSRNNNTTIELMAARGISSAELIPGRVIQIPVPNPAYCLNTRPRVIHSGDTAFSLARNHNLTLEQFRIMNNLDASYTLSLGQVICVP